MIEQKTRNIRNFFLSGISNYSVIIGAVTVLLVIVWMVYIQIKSEVPDPTTIMFMLITIVVIFLFLGVLILSNRVSSIFLFVKRGKKRASRLRRRIIIAFSIGAGVPAITVAIFSVYFFNQSVQTWFDKKVTNVLDQSVNIGELYVSEHVMQLKETAISVSEDLSSMYYDLIHNTELFNKVLNAQAEMRSLDEAIVFQKDTNTILAQTSLSFSLSFTNIPAHLIEKAVMGDVVNVSTGHGKIRMLIKLHDYKDTFLLVGRLVDEKILDHIDKTKGAVAEYVRLKNNINYTQIKFTFIFITITLILVVLALIGGRNFAERLVIPIRNLVIAAEKVKAGNLSARVPDEYLKKDEIKVLSSAFNRMIAQIERQQKELLVAQKALAWSDVARQIAHEIKNPLTPIHLSATTLLSKYETQVDNQDEFKKYLNIIIRKSNEINSIVSEFVNFAKLPSPSFTKCEIVSFINDLIEARRLINTKITYKFIHTFSTFDFVCDITQFNQILENLLQNAEHALQDNKDPSITITLEQKNNEFILILSDNGSGISEELTKRVLEPYFTSKENGMGLGLAIVNRLVQEHFGTVEIFNNEVGLSVKLSFDISILKDKIN